MNKGQPAKQEELLFDWEGTHQQTIHIDEIMTTAGTSSSESLQDVWQRRAAKLARVPIQKDHGERVNLALVRLGREIYGLNAQYIWDIQPLGQLTLVPRVPDWVAGVVNRRGRIYSVVDLLRFFNLPAGEGAGTAELIIVEIPSMELGLMVDQVLGVEAMPVDQIQERNNAVRSLPPEYVLGVIDHDGASGTESSHVVVLDLLALLADERLVIHEEIN